MATWTFNDLDEFIDSIRDANIEMMHHNIVRHIWSLRYLDASDIHIQQGSEGSGNITTGQSPADGYILLQPLRNAEAQRVNGVPLHTNSIAILEPGCEFYTTSPVDQDWCSVFIATDRLTSLSSPSRAECRVVRVAQEVANQCQDFTQRILDAAESCERVVSSGALDSALLDLCQLSSQIIQHGEVAITGQNGRTPISRVEILHRIKSLFKSHEDKPLSLRDLVSASGVSERTFRSLFQDYFGVAPHRYLQLRQLHQIYRALRAAEQEQVLVSEILLKYGAWEFGRTARRYRDTFGELPSETLRKASSF